MPELKKYPVQTHSTESAMAHDTVSAVIESLPSRKELMVHSPRTAAVRQCVKDVLEACSKEGNKERFAQFSLELLTLLKSTLESSKPTALSQRRERLWITFCKLRAERLPTLWKEFLPDIYCNSSIKEPLFMEIVNETLLERTCMLFPNTRKACQHPQRIRISPKMKRTLYDMPVGMLE